ncbi:MAG: GNAT family N-acetyltransferase, partial [Acidobacteriota bacterium]
NQRDMAGPSLDYGLASQEDAPQLLELYQELYPGLGWTREHMAWQYFENPNGHARIWVARDGDRIVAAYTAIPHRMSVHGKIAPGWRVQDVMTRPEYRGRGIYHELAQRAADSLFRPEFPLNFTFPNEQSHKAFIGKGWVEAFRVPLYLFSGRIPESKPAGSAEVASFEDFDARAEEIWSAHVSRAGFAVHRTKEHLDWRYRKHRKSKYFPFRVTRDGETLILVLKRFDREDGSRWGHLVDWFSTSVDPPLLRSGFEQFLLFARESACHSMSCWSPGGSGMEPLLDEYGFRKQKDLTRWVVAHREGSPGEQREIRDESRWFLSMGDSDVF